MQFPACSLCLVALIQAVEKQFFLKWHVRHGFQPGMIETTHIIFSHLPGINDITEAQNPNDIREDTEDREV